MILQHALLSQNPNLHAPAGEPMGNVTLVMQNFCHWSNGSMARILQINNAYANIFAST